MRNMLTVVTFLGGEVRKANVKGGGKCSALQTQSFKNRRRCLVFRRFREATSIIICSSSVCLSVYLVQVGSRASFNLNLV